MTEDHIETEIHCPKPVFHTYEGWTKKPDGRIFVYRYGRRFLYSEKRTNLDIELQAFREGWTVDEGAMGKCFHAKRAMELMFNTDPEDPGIIWTDEAELFLERACQWKYLAVAGSGSSGKSHPAAAWGLLNFYASPRNTKVLLTSTSIGAGCDRVWGSVIDLYNKIPEEVRKVGKLNDSKHIIKYVGDDEKSKLGTRRGLELVAAEPRQAKEAVQKLIGRKQTNLILIADELTDISPSVNAAFFTNLSRNPNSQMIGLGNPSDWFNAMGELCMPEAGVNSVNIWTREWKTVRGWGIHFDDMVSFNYNEGKKKVDVWRKENPNLVGTPEERKAMERLGNKRWHVWRPSYWEIEESRRLDGENSLLFIRMSRGWFATNGASDSIYNNADMLANMVYDVEWGDVPPTKLIAIDLSFSSHGDRSVMMLFQAGRDKNGKRMLECLDDVILQDDATKEDETRSGQLCKQIADYVAKHNVEHRYVAYDSTGGGAPFGDMLVGYLSKKILPVCFGGKATDRPVSAANQNPSCSRYANRCSEIWYSGVEILRGRQFANLPKEAMSEMCNRTYTTVGQGKIQVQSKRDIKAKGQPSPDYADCVHIALDLCRERLHFTSEERGVNVLPKEDFLKQLKRLDINSRSGRLARWSRIAS